MPQIKLTEKSINRKPPVTGRIELWDKILPGFGLRISDSGHRAYFVMARVHGRQIRRTIGTTEAYKLADAREAARDILRNAARDIDPKEAERQEKIETARARRNTFRAVAEDYMKHHAARLKSKGDMQARLDRDILPEWGSRPIRDITRSDVRTLLRDKALKYPIAANRILALVRSIFNWALDEELIDASPAARVRPPGEETARERVLNDEEVKKLWSGFEQLGEPFGPLFQILLLTGQRRNEVAGMKWAEIENDIWRLPGERTKSGKGHLIPLSPLAKQILEGVSEIEGCKHVFTTARRGGRPVSGWGKTKNRLDLIVAKEVAKGAGEPLDMKKHGIADWTIHDLRRTFATGLRSLGVDRLTVSKCLNHAEAGITQVYDRYSADPEKREALKKWAEHIQQLVSSPNS